MSYQVGMGLNLEFTGREIETIIEAVEYRNQRIVGISGLPEHYRNQLLKEYDAVLVKLERIKGELQ